jgi:hypothetical protein
MGLPEALRPIRVHLFPNSSAATSMGFIQFIVGCAIKLQTQSRLKMYDTNIFIETKLQFNSL